LWFSLCVGTEGTILLLSELWFPDIGKSGCIVDGSQLVRQDEYLNRRLSQCERDTTHINNVLNQLPTFDQIESLITK
jgi:hypothetical protein